MTNTESPIQNLTFHQLKAYYLGKSLLFNDDMFEENMHLLTEDGKFNMLACFLADNGEIPVRVSVFSGKDKAAPLFSVKEFGNQSLVSVIDRIIDYSDSINMIRSIDHFDTGTREDIPMFDQACFDEALKNAFIHNNWLRRVAPMTTFYENRIEITSFSSLAPNQTTEGFYKGRSVPVNEELSSIFLATHLSERTGRGNPLIVSHLGKEAFQIEESSITVTIPYNWQRRFENVIENPIDKVIDNLSVNERNVLRILQKNPKATHEEIGRQIGLGPTSVYKIIASLRKKGILVREGSNKKGNWKIRASDK